MNSAARRCASRPSSSSSGCATTRASRLQAKVFPTTARVCSSAFSAAGSRSMRAVNTACTVAGHWIAANRPAPPAPRRLLPPGPRPYQPALLDEALDDLLDEERVALRLVKNQLLEGLEDRTAGCPAILPHQGGQQLLGFCRAQGVQPQLGVIGLAAPDMLIFGAIVHQQQEAHSGQALAQQVQPRLSLAVEPVQILDE